MASTRTQTRSLERIERIRRDGLTPLQLRERLLGALRDAVDFDASVWLLTDPVSCVGAAPLADVPCLPELPALIRAKYLTTVNRWTTLASTALPVGLLHQAVEGRLTNSLVWRKVMSRYGITDVASVAFADQFGCWAFLDLWRGDGDVPFGPDDAAILCAVAPVITVALREAQARTFVEVATPHRRDLGPVVLTLNDELMITSRTAASADWLDQLVPPVLGASTVPASVYNVAAQLLAGEAGVDGHAAVARTHLVDGFWLTLRAARLAACDEPPPQADGHSAGIVVTIEETSASDRLELFSLATGLSARERQLVAILATGADTRTLARQMRLSEHTVQDHLTSIFAKTGARDRITVLSRALGTRRPTVTS